MFIQEASFQASRLLHLLIERQQTIATVESCTGGLLASLLTGVAGSSLAYLAGWITYGNDAKERDVSVPRSVLETKGAVSEEAASCMAQGGQKKAQTDYAIAITGIAGPSGGSAYKPVGLVYIAVAAKSKPTICKKYLHQGSRDNIRQQSCNKALELTFNILLT